MGSGLVPGKTWNSYKDPEHSPFTSLGKKLVGSGDSVLWAEDIFGTGLPEFLRQVGKPPADRPPVPSGASQETTAAQKTASSMINSFGKRKADTASTAGGPKRVRFKTG